MDGGVGMRKTVGLMIVGIVLVALGLSGALLPNTPCDVPIKTPAQCYAPFPLAALTALAGTVVLVVGFLLYLRGGNRRREVRAETR
jgi:hypothetical protein